MRIEKLKNLEINTVKSKGFAFETPPDLPSAHGVFLFCGKRQSGKTLSCVNLLEKMKYDRIFVISPSVKSNKEYMDKLNLNPDDIEDDVDDITCIDRILAKIDQERDDLEEYWEKLERYKKLSKQLNEGYLLNDLEDEDLLDMYNPLTNNFEKPKHKYNGKIPMIAILFDDVVGSMLFTKGIRKLNKLTIYARHISPFTERGGAVGVSLFYLCQVFKATCGGISKAIRNNTTSLVLFKTKNENELRDVQQECSGEIDEATFYKMYEYATAEPHSFLFIDFHPKEPKYRFRKHWNELLIPEEINEKLETEKKNNDISKEDVPKTPS
jgi:hypothetical protein